MTTVRAAWIRMRARNAITSLKENPEQVLGRVAVLMLLSVSALFIVVPLYWLFVAAFRAPGTFTFPPELVPAALSLHGLSVVVTETRFVGTYLVNSILVSAATVVLTVAVATPAGFSLSRYDLPFERAILVALLGLQMIPILAMIIPLYRLFAVFDLLDTLAVVVLADTILVVPIATWLIKGQFDTIPTGLEEAARVGGASRWQAFKILLPLGRPAIGTAAIYAFVVSWNQFIIPLTFTSSQRLWTYPVGLYGFISRRGVVDWGLLGAASLVAMLPVLLLFVLFQRQFLVGLMGAGIGGESS